MFVKDKPLTIPSAAEALVGRAEKIQVSDTHFVNNNKTNAPYPTGYQLALFGLGCFWGAEKKYWEAAGVYITAVGYAAGSTPNPSYQEVCSGQTGHNEVVLVVYDPAVITYAKLLSIFWNSHNPTQGMCQGNDRGTQYRSGIYYYSAEQQQAAIDSCTIYQKIITENGFDKITTEIITTPEFYFAEDYHQQYLAKNPNGYCGLGGIGIEYPKL
ncbi:Peptide-methionine (S)-S-oxide reductase MsrA [hydrothermal vent metagenome]|uniref:peptide-methionine (S)-S-oxide reductase n=1 Tax=hydrothermal vent metagenome TaxID=652676 RepID=A0A3B0ZUQ3_9ZZZZ